MDLPLVPPPTFPPGALSPAQQRGLRYQARVGRWLAQCASHRWDIHVGPWLVGPTGPCQPDFVLTPRTGGTGGVAPGADLNEQRPIVVIETKLTQCDCTAQLAKYKRALRHLGSVVTIQIARRVVTAPTVRSLDDPRDGHMLLWL